MPKSHESTSETQKASGFVATPKQRILKLASLSARVATHTASRHMKGLFQSSEAKEASLSDFYQRIGDEMAETLGQMKGAVMKVGQIASQMKDIFPPEIAEALATLQNTSQPMPFSVIEEQIKAQLGENAEELLHSMVQEPHAAASIGQVHRAQLANGEQVIVKVQYPGVRESCEADLKHLRQLFQLGGLLKVDPNVIEALFQEVKTLLFKELDYASESQNLVRFQEFYQQDASMVIPRVHGAYSTQQILTLSYEDGMGLNDDALSQQSVEDRNWIGDRLFNMVCEQLFQLKTLHVDPHPGNFAYRINESGDRQLIIYDFGAIKDLPEDMINPLKELVLACLDRRYDQIEALLKARGLRRPDTPALDGAYYHQWLDIILQPFQDQVYDFSQTDLHRKVAEKIRKSVFQGLKLFQPTPESIHLDRVFSGHYWNLILLGAKLNLHPKLMPYLQKESGGSIYE